MTHYPSGQGYVAAPPRHHSFLTDIYLGAIYGDFATDVRIPGHITQAVLAFVPGFGTIFAARDFIADRRHGDGLGAFLNALALVPFLGGFPKTAAVIRSVRHVGLAARAVRRQRQHASSPQQGTSRR